MIEAFQHAPDRAAVGLGRIGGPKAIAALKDKLLSQPSQTIAEALVQSGQMGVKALRTALKSDNVKVRRVAGYGIRLAKTSGQGNDG